MVVDPLAKLHEVFGYNQFRGVQEQVVDRVLNRQRTLAVMPTGAGKSLCYQLPAVMMDGCCVVVSPLIALMHDQLRAAEAVGIRAATLTSVDQNRAETVARFRDGQLDLLYVAPSARRRDISASCSPPRRSACSRSTRRTASANGGTTSAPTIACSNR